MNVLSQAVSPRALRWLLLAPFLAAHFLVLPGCASPAYYSQAISGHMGIMRQRKDIEEILRSDETDRERARELELSVEIREFASSNLLLPDNGSYTQYVQTGKEAVTWNVVAAPEFSLQPKQWCFIVSGCVPYRGYFNVEDARRLAMKLGEDGYDTAVSPAIAYSTLGWFDDPLLDTMFQYSDEQLAAFIFHELAHQGLYVRGDTAFNEAYASFIGETGVRLWLDSSGRSDRLPAWEEQQMAGIQFNALLRQTQEDLKELYSSGLPAGRMRHGKSIVYEDQKAAYRQLVESQWNGRGYFDSLMSREMNNARMALVSSYRGGVCAFERLYRSVQGDMARFQQLAKQKGALGKKQRQAWLNQSCEVIASSDNL